MRNELLDIKNYSAFEYLQSIQNTLGVELDSDFTKSFVKSAQAKYKWNRNSEEKFIIHLVKIRKMLLNKEYTPKKNYLAEYTKFHNLLEKISIKKVKNRVDNEDVKKLVYAATQQAFMPRCDLINKGYKKIIEHNKDKNLKNTIWTEKLWAKLLGNVAYDGAFSKRGNKKDWSRFWLPDSSFVQFFSTICGIAFYPLKHSNLPFVYSAMKLSHNESGKQHPTCIRAGTQVHQNLGKAEYNNGFMTFLKVFCAQTRQERKENGEPDDAETDIQYVYINLQKGIKSQDPAISAYAENVRTQKLHKIERKIKGVAVISLPADNKWFNGGFNFKTGVVDSKYSNENLGHLLDSLVDSILEDKNDFQMSVKVKQKLFAKVDSVEFEKLLPEVKKETIKKVIEDDFYNSVRAMQGGSSLTNEQLAEQTVDPATRQAILFDFVKFKFTNFILKKLNPAAYNDTCKDGIDRAEVQKLWYWFRQKTDRSSDYFDINKLPTENEFLKLVDMPATLVLGRPLNHHRNFLWNSLNKYYANLDPALKKEMSWVKQWLAKNRHSYELTGFLEAIQKKKDKDPKSIKIIYEGFNGFRKARGKTYNVTLTDKNDKLLAKITIDPKNNHLSIRELGDTSDNFVHDYITKMNHDDFASPSENLDAQDESELDIADVPNESLSRSMVFRKKQIPLEQTSNAQNVKKEKKPKSSYISSIWKAAARSITSNVQDSEEPAAKKPKKKKLLSMKFKPKQQKSTRKKKTNPESSLSYRTKEQVFSKQKSKRNKVSQKNEHQTRNPPPIDKKH